MSNERRGRARRTLASVAVLGVVAATFLVGLDAAGATSPVGDTTVYGVQSFSGAVGSQWSDPSVTPLTRIANPTAAPNKVLGPHGNETVYLTLHGLPAHSQITINYDFLALLTWDGETTEFGPDTFQMQVGTSTSDLATVFDSTFTVCGDGPQSFPLDTPATMPARSGAIAADTYSGPGCFGDSTYRLSDTVAHTSSDVVFAFTGSNLEDLSNENWALDNLSVSVGDTPNVAPVATAPTPVNPYFTPTDTPLALPTAALLAGDTDANVGDTLVPVLAAAAHGTITRTSLKAYRYQPDPGFEGTDTLTYYAFDGQALSAPVTFPIEVGVAHATLADGSVTETNKGTNTVLSFTVVLNKPSPVAGYVLVSTGDGSATAPLDYTALTGKKVLVPRGATTVHVSVTIKGDNLVEGSPCGVDDLASCDTFSLSFSGASKVTLDEPGSAIGTIIDNDGAAPA